MLYKYIIEKKPSKFLELIPKKDKEKIIQEIESLKENPRKEGVIKLTDKNPPEYRARQGNYRIVFKIQDEFLIITVIRIFIRGDDY